MLDEDLLKTATRLLGAKTYSAAVNQALKEAIRSTKARGLSEFFGTNVWEGNLSEIRDDKPKRKRK